MAIDVGLISLVSLLVATGVQLILSAVSASDHAKAVIAAIGGVLYFFWAAGYFTVFWTTTGQTPGSRVMQIRVQTTRGETIGVKRALIRCVSLLLCAWPLFLGFAPIPFDSKRRSLADRMSGTLVIEAEQESLAQAKDTTRRLKAREARAAIRPAAHP